MRVLSWLNFSLVLILALTITACKIKGDDNGSNSAMENVLILTDVHFDPYTSCGSTPTPDAQQCVLNLVAEPNPNSWNFPASSPNTYSQDTNNTLFQSELQRLTKYVNQNHVTKIFLLGDLLSHDFPSDFATYVPGGTQTQLTSLALYTINYVIYNIVHATHAKIYYVLGNNDTDTFDYKSPTASFMQQIVPLISPYMADPASFASTFGSGGYSVMKFNNNTNVIGLNFNPLTEQNENSAQEIAIANQQLAWLDGELQTARRQNKKVILLHHEPFGINTYYVATGAQPSNPRYTVLNPTLQTQYLNEYSNYSSIINNYYYGHYHMDSIQVTDKLFAFSTLAFNVLFNNNPGFKIITLNQQGQLKNYITYYSNYANSTIDWQSLYALNSTYNVKSGSYVKFFTNFPSSLNSSYVKDYIKFYNGLNTSPSQQQPINQPGKYIYYYCGMKKMTVSEYLACLATFK